MAHWPTYVEGCTLGRTPVQGEQFYPGCSEAAPLPKLHSSLANTTMGDSEVLPWGYRWRSSSVFITGTICVAIFSGKIPRVI